MLTTPDSSGLPPEEATAPPKRGWLQAIRPFLTVVGPGLVVMLADTDAGSIITAAESGARWGYRLLSVQFLLIPVLYLAQELTVRLALGTGQGLADLIWHRVGRWPAIGAMLALVISCLGALATQFSGLAGIGQLFGIPAWATVLFFTVVILIIVWSGSYRSVERIAIAFGLLELAFLVAAWKLRPSPAHLIAEASDFPYANPDFLLLLAANIGTCIMPWTLFHQQSALIDKGLKGEHLSLARIDTAVGSIVCQLVTAAVVVAAAGAIGNPRGIGDIPGINAAFIAALGPRIGTLIFAGGLAGGALVATLVVSLTAAWSFGETMGKRHSLANHPREAPWFYGAFTALVIAAAAVVLSGLNFITLAIAAGAVNAILIPVILVLLWWLARRVVPEDLRLKGPRAGLTAGLFILISVIGLVSGLVGGFG